MSHPNVSEGWVSESEAKSFQAKPVLLRKHAMGENDLPAKERPISEFAAGDRQGVIYHKTTRAGKGRHESHWQPFPALGRGGAIPSS